MPITFHVTPKGLGMSSTNEKDRRNHVFTNALTHCSSWLKRLSRVVISIWVMYVFLIDHCFEKNCWCVFIFLEGGWDDMEGERELCVSGAMLVLGCAGALRGQRGD